MVIAGPSPRARISPVAMARSIKGRCGLPSISDSSMGFPRPAGPDSTPARTSRHVPEEAGRPPKGQDTERAAPGSVDDPAGSPVPPGKPPSRGRHCSVWTTDQTGSRSPDAEVTVRGEEGKEEGAGAAPWGQDGGGCQL